MTTLALPPPRKKPLLSFGNDSDHPNDRRPRLLVFTADDPFWQKLVAAGVNSRHKLLREREPNNTGRSLRLFNPGAVLFDLDWPSAWGAVDLLLQDRSAPPVLLLTSRGDQVDFKTAIEAGSLIDKCINAATVFALAELALEIPDSARQEQNALQQGVVRWLKPCAELTRGTPLRRFWGINE